MRKITRDYTDTLPRERATSVLFKNKHLSVATHVVTLSHDQVVLNVRETMVNSEYIIIIIIKK